MFLLNTLRNLLPFLFELEALVVVLNTPLMFVGIEFCLSWLGKRKEGKASSVNQGRKHLIREFVDQSKRPFGEFEVQKRISER